MDRISELPEHLITQILSNLPLKQSVTTSALSTSWKNHWLHVPILDLEDNDFPFGMSTTFLDKFLSFNPRSRLQTLKLSSSSMEIDGLKDWISTVINRGVQHLDVESSEYYLGAQNAYPYIDITPPNLYTSKTLVSLKLSRSGLEDPGFVFLPCLKLMHLRDIRWVAPMTLEKLLAGCPVLEELTFLRNLCYDFEDLNKVPQEVTRVRSRSLKRFFLPYNRKFHGPGPEYVLEIDAPGLEFMRLKEDYFDRIVVKNLTSLLTIDLYIKFFFGPCIAFGQDVFSKRHAIRDFLSKITSVRHMIISLPTLKVLELYSRLGPIPKFNSLSRLQAVFSSSLLLFLPTILESCPNLKYLTMNVGDTQRMDIWELTSVPQCLLSSLECVVIKEMFKWKEEEKKIASYFVENSSVLKKLILRFLHRTFPRDVSESDIYEELSHLTKRSPGCRIVIDYHR